MAPTNQSLLILLWRHIKMNSKNFLFTLIIGLMARFGSPAIRGER